MERTIDAWHSDPIGFNVPTGIDEININEPSLGYFSWSPDAFSLILGRFPVHWSPSLKYGTSLTSSVPYHDGLLWSLKAPAVQYHLLISSINPWLSGTPSGIGDSLPAGSEEYLQINPQYPNNRDFNSRNRVYSEPVKTLIAHRLEAGVSWLQIGINELAMIGGKQPSLRDGNPFVVFHNNYGDGYTNSNISLDITAKFFKKIKLFGEITFEDLKEADDGGTPTILGWMAGATNLVLVGKKMIYQQLHIVYTDPLMYNHYRPYLKMYSRHVVKSNFIPIGSKPFVDTYVIDYPLGYFRGPDALDTWYDFSLYMSKDLAVHINTGYLRQGRFDPWSPFEKISISAPSSLEEKEWRFYLSGDLKLPKNVSFLAGYGFQYTENYQHKAGNTVFHQQVFTDLGWSWK